MAPSLRSGRSTYKARRAALGARQVEGVNGASGSPLGWAAFIVSRLRSSQEVRCPVRWRFAPDRLSAHGHASGHPNETHPFARPDTLEPAPTNAEHHLSRKNPTCGSSHISVPRPCLCPKQLLHDQCERGLPASSAPKSIPRCHANPFLVVRCRCVAFRATPFACLCTPSSGCIDIPSAEPQAMESYRTGLVYGIRRKFVPSSLLLVRLRQRRVQSLRSKRQERIGISFQLRRRVVRPLSD